MAWKLWWPPGRFELRNDSQAIEPIRKSDGLEALVDFWAPGAPKWFTGHPFNNGKYYFGGSGKLLHPKLLKPFSTFIPY